MEPQTDLLPRAGRARGDAGRARVGAGGGRDLRTCREPGFGAHARARYTHGDWCDGMAGGRGCGAARSHSRGRRSRAGLRPGRGHNQAAEAPSVRCCGRRSSHGCIGRDSLGVRSGSGEPAARVESDSSESGGHLEARVNPGTCPTATDRVPGLAARCLPRCCRNAWKRGDCRAAQIPVRHGP